MEGQKSMNQVDDICTTATYYQQFDEDTRPYLSDKDKPSYHMTTQANNPSNIPQVPQQHCEASPQNSGGSVARRNERERKRVRMVNMGFAKLRQYVPLATRGKRLSKVETLRSAIDYIRQLRQLLLYHQQRVEDPGPVYYHIYDHQQRMYQTFEYGAPGNQGCFYDGVSPVLAGDTTLECGGSTGGWSLSSDSPCPSIESEMTASPQYAGMLEPDAQMPCWTV